MFRLSNTKSLTTTPYIVCFGYLVSPVYKTTQPRQARAGYDHHFPSVMKENVGLVSEAYISGPQSSLQSKDAFEDMPCSQGGTP